MSDVGTVVWKEWREQFLRRGRPSRSTWGALFFVGILGIGTPIFFAFVFGNLLRGAAARSLGGDAFLVSMVALTGVIAMAYQGAVVTIGFVVDSFAGERERHTLETLLAGPLPDRAILAGKILASALFILASTVAFSIFQFAACLVLWGGAGFGYAGALLAGPLLGTLAGILVASIGAMVSMRAATVKAAAQILGLILLPLYMLPGLLNTILSYTDPGRAVVRFYQFVGPAWFVLIVGAGLVVVDAALFALALRLFRRDRLILRK
ncbi:MAG: ABC transporter permease subunit [bacterium]